MIYTLGHTENYTKYFKEQGIPCKKGRTSRYCGGSVWKTYEDAKKRCPIYYSVYGVRANWKKDTIPSKNGPWNDLLLDSKLVKLKRT